MAKVKKFFFPGTTLIISFYISILFAVGIIVGYFVTRYLAERRKLNSIILNLGKWEIHLHHWLIGGLVIFVSYTLDWFSTLPIFCWGAIGGLIFHGVYSYKNWYKIIYKKGP